MITHTTHDHTRTAENGKLDGNIHHAFYSPTHWSTPCEVVVRYNPYSPRPEISLSYGSGGWERSATPTQVALAMAQIFTQAAVLLASLEASHTA